VVNERAGPQHTHTQREREKGLSQKLHIHGGEQEKMGGAKWIGLSGLAFCGKNR